MVTKKDAPEVDPWEVKGDSHPVVRSSEWATITLKAGAGYNVPWLVFKPTSFEDAKDIMQHEDLEELIDLVARRNKEFERAYGGTSVAASKPTVPGGWGSKGQAPAQPTTEVPSGTCPTHNCDLVYVEPFKKRDGSEISARVACPVPKCYAKTFWHNKDGSWTEK